MSVRVRAVLKVRVSAVDGVTKTEREDYVTSRRRGRKRSSETVRHRARKQPVPVRARVIQRMSMRMVCLEFLWFDHRE